MKDSNCSPSNPSSPTLREVEDALAKINGRIFYLKYESNLSESPLLRQAIIALQVKGISNLKYFEGLVSSPHKEVLQQAIINPNQLGLNCVEDKLENLISYPELIPAISAFKKMGGDNLEILWPNFKLHYYYSSFQILYEMGLGNIQKKWPEFTENSESLSLALQSLHYKKEKLTEELWNKLILNKELPYLLYELYQMGATTLIDKIDELDKIGESGKRDNILKLENNLATELVNAFKKMHANYIDEKLDLLAANPDLLPWVITLGEMGSKNIDEKWPVIESQNPTILESIYILKERGEKKIDPKWATLTTETLLPQAIIALKNMSYELIPHRWDDFFGRDATVTSEVLIWFQEVGIRPTEQQWIKFSHQINKTCFLVLKEMNIDNPATQWDQLLGNRELRDSLLILRKTNLKLNNTVWEALTQKKDFPQAILALRTLGILHTQQFQPQWSALIEDEVLVQSLVALNNHIVFDVKVTLWEKLKKNSLLQKFILILNDTLKEHLCKERLYLDFEIYDEKIFQNALLSLIELGVNDLRYKSLNLCLRTLYGNEDKQALPNAIIALKTLNRPARTISSKVLDSKWSALNGHLIVQNIIITLGKLERNNLLTATQFNDFMKLFNELPTDKSEINSSLLKKLEAFLKALNTSNLFNEATEPKDSELKTAPYPTTTPQVIPEIKKTTPISLISIPPVSTNLEEETEISLEGFFGSPENSEDQIGSPINNKFNSINLMNQGQDIPDNNSETAKEIPIHSLVEVPIENISTPVTLSPKSKTTPLKEDNINSYQERVNSASEISLNQNQTPTSKEHPSQPENRGDISNKQQEQEEQEKEREREREREREKTFKSVHSKNEDPNPHFENNLSGNIAVEPQPSNINPFPQEASNTNSSENTRVKKASNAYFFLNTLSFFAGCGGILSVVAALATFTLPPLLVGLGLIGAFFFFEHLNKPSSPKTEIREHSELNIALS